MIISGNAIQNVIKVYGDQSQVAKNSKSVKIEVNQKKDEFILSSGAQEFSQVFNTIKGISDVRENKVKELSEQIEAGTYKVDSYSIAEKMLGSYAG